LRESQFRNPKIVPNRFSAEAGVKGKESIDFRLIIWNHLLKRGFCFWSGSILATGGKVGVDGRKQLFKIILERFKSWLLNFQD
jgi:hypothetical protein